MLLQPNHLLVRGSNRNTPISPSIVRRNRELVDGIATVDMRSITRCRSGAVISPGLYTARSRMCRAYSAICIVRSNITSLIWSLMSPRPGTVWQLLSIVKRAHAWLVERMSRAGSHFRDRRMRGMLCGLNRGRSGSHSLESTYIA